MGDPTPRTALLRLSGEIGIKARATRLQFRKRLIHNLRDALAGETPVPRVEVSHDRLYVELPETASLAHHPIARVFGVQSLSLVERHPVTALADVVRTGAELFADAVRGRRFAVRARRVGPRDRVAASPRELERQLGTALLAHAAGVDLGDPEVTVRLELAEHATAFFTERAQGPGGLPLGVEGRAVALFSGGFDSAVAAWQIQKRGVALDHLFCNLGGEAHLRGVFRVAKELADRWSYGSQPALVALDFQPVAEAIQRHAERRYWQVLLKRQMLRAAAAVADARRAQAIVTGESVGQVSSQTLQNLAVISRAVPHAVLRPLVGSDKDEITALARRIGTFDLSKVVGEYCALVPSRPATRATLRAVEREEAKLPADVLARSLDSRSRFDLRALGRDAFENEDLAVERVPEGAVLIDLRPLAHYRSVHHPDALHLDFPSAQQAYPSFDRGRVYVLSCEFGLLSAHLAEQMRRDGFRAHYLRGGQRALMRAASVA